MLKPKTETVPVPPDQEFDIEIKYYVINFDSVVKILEKTKFCEQELSLDCNDGSLQLGAGKYGWYSRDGNLQTYWAGSPNGEWRLRLFRFVFFLFVCFVCKKS